VWAEGGVYGSIHDLSLSEATGLFALLFEGEFILADKGYESADAPFLHPIKQVENQQEWDTNTELARIRVLVENVNARLKNFACLVDAWRHSVDDHRAMFQVICNVVNLDMDLHPLRRPGIDMLQDQLA